MEDSGTELDDETEEAGATEEGAAEEEEDSEAWSEAGGPRYYS